MTMAFDSCGRMKYNPEFHHNQGNPYTISEQKYLIEHYVKLGAQTLSLELGRTESSIGAKVSKLRKAGEMTPAQKNKKYNKRHITTALL